MQALADGGGARLQLTSATTSPLAIDVLESPEMRIQRLISESPVIIFSSSTCCMCHVMKSLLYTIGVHPTVIEPEHDEVRVLRAAKSSILYIGGERVGGPEGLLALHLSGHLVPKLVEVGALGNI